MLLAGRQGDRLNTQRYGDTWLLFKITPASQTNKKRALGNSMPGRQRGPAHAAATKPIPSWISSSCPRLSCLAQEIRCLAQVFRQLALPALDAEQSHIMLSACFSLFRSLELSSPDTAPKIIADAIQKEMVSGSAHVSLAQDQILITEDRAYRCLTEWKRDIETSGKWIAPSCLFASLLLTFITATFHDEFNLSKEMWQAAYLWGILAAGIWTIGN